MKTKIIKIDQQNIKDKDLQDAASIIKNGGLAIIPTETVYGIAANMLNRAAVERLSRIKQRPKDKPFSLLIDKKEAVEEYAVDIPISAYKLIAAFWPGPLTLVLKSGAEGTIGLRMPDNVVALKIVSLSGVPVICPSANLSGSPAPVDFEQAIGELDGKVDLAIDNGKARLGLESSVVDLSTETLRVLREAAIKKEAIEDTAGKKTVLFICTGNSCRSVMAEAQLKKRLKEKGRQGIEVLSAGIMGFAGSGATESTKQVLAEEGIDISEHCSRMVDREMLKRSDIILVMERLHEERVRQIAPELKNKVFLLKEFVKKKDNNLDIEDPIGQPIEFYEQVLAVIKEAVEKIIEII